MSEELRKQLVDQLENLNKVMPEFRKAEDQMKSAKAAVCTTNIKIAATDAKFAPGDLARMVKSCLMAW